MKNRGIQRDVRPQRFERSAGDAPNLGRTERMAGTGLPRERRRRRRGEQGRGTREGIRHQRVMWTWSVVLVVVSLAVIAVAVLGWLGRNMGRESTNDRVEATTPVRQTNALPEFESPTEREALNLVRRGLAIRDETEVDEYFHPGTASPGQIVGFLTDLEKVDGAIESLTWLGSVNANRMEIEGVLVKTSIDYRQRNRLALLTPDETGDWKIDFDAFARNVSPSWDELLGERAAEGVVRVIVAPDSYYNGPFRDDSQWDCYGMVSPDTEVMMMGYCRKGSPQAEAMNRIVADDDRLSGGRRSKRATLEVRRLEGAESRQFEISRVLAEDWVLSAAPFDENFH